MVLFPTPVQGNRIEAGHRNLWMAAEKIREVVYCCLGGGEM